MGKRVLITGATGMVGSQVLKELIELDSVSSILSIGRRKTGIQSSKLKEIIPADFSDFSGLKEELSNIDLCIYCLAVYQNKVSKDEFFEITCNYQKALTDILEKTSPQLTFALFGASGANPEEKGWTTFANAKGRAENFLNETTFPRKYIFRSGPIFPTGNRKPTGLMYTFLMPIAKLIFKLFPSVGLTDNELAKLMVKASINAQFESKTFSSREMINLVRNEKALENN